MQLGGFDRWDIAGNTRAKLDRGWLTASTTGAGAYGDALDLERAIMAERAELRAGLIAAARARGLTEEQAQAEAARKLG